MRDEIIVTTTVALLLSLAPCAAQAQSLVETARQERTRRLRIAPENRARVYANDDLRDSGGLTIGAAPQATVPQPDAGSGRAGHGIGEGGEDAGAEADAGEVPGESDWRARMRNVREARERAALMASALQNRADGLCAQFTAVDDPARRRVVERQRTEALAELDRSQMEAAHLDRQIRDIQEEARRAGVPPGWLR